jgi:hypothetical protein
MVPPELDENDFSIKIFFISQRKRFIPLTNQQQLDCLLKHIEHSQHLNLWSKQTEKSCNGINSNIIDDSPNNLKQKQMQAMSSNSLSTPTLRSHTEPSITKVQKQNKPKLEWVVLPVFVDIVRLALKAREDCSTR